jgi:hypothetical protein
MEGNGAPTLAEVTRRVCDLEYDMRELNNLAIGNRLKNIEDGITDLKRQSLHNDRDKLATAKQFYFVIIGNAVGLVSALVIGLLLAK